MTIEKRLLAETSYWSIIKKNVVGGIAWALGVTIGFALISSIVVFVLGRLGGLPVIGEFIAEIVEATNNSLLNR